MWSTDDTAKHMFVEYEGQLNVKRLNYKTTCIYNIYICIYCI